MELLPLLRGQAEVAAGPEAAPVEVAAVRALLVSTTVYPVGHRKYGGIERFIYDFAAALARLGVEVSLAAPKGSVAPEGVELIETVELPRQRDRDDLAYYWYCHRLGEFDVVHDFSHMKVAALRDPGLPAVNMVWNPNPSAPLPSYNLMCLSRHHAQRVADMTGRPVKYEDVCVDPERYPLRKDKEDYFLFLGNLVYGKGAHNAVRLARRLGVKVYIAGGLGDRAYVDWLISTCDGERAVFLGDVDEQVKVRLLQGARALIYPVEPQHALEMAHWQAGVEALLCGTPLITYALGPLPELFEHGRHGYLARSEEEFAAYMLEADSVDPRECRRYAEQRYSPARVARAYLEEVYRPLAERGERW